SFSAIGSFAPCELMGECYGQSNEFARLSSLFGSNANSHEYQSNKALDNTGFGDIVAVITGSLPPTSPDVSDSQPRLITRNSLMTNLGKKVEFAANIAIVIVACLLGTVLVKNYLLSKPADPLLGANSRTSQAASDSSIHVGTKLSNTDIQ